MLWLVFIISISVSNNFWWQLILIAIILLLLLLLLLHVTHHHHHHRGLLLLLLPHPIKYTLHLRRHPIQSSITTTIVAVKTISIIAAIPHNSYTRQHRLLVLILLHQLPIRLISSITHHHLCHTLLPIHQHHIRTTANREAIVRSEVLLRPLFATTIVVIIIVQTPTIPRQLLLVIVQLQLKTFK